MVSMRRYLWLLGSLTLFFVAALIAGASLSRPVAAAPAGLHSAGLAPQATSLPPKGGAAPQTCAYAWQTVSSANGGPGNNYLSGIASAGLNGVWAVGFYANGNTEATLTEHWDGNNWIVVPSPNVGSGNNRLFAVTANASNDVWAVGYYYNGTVNRNLTEHWDGSSWTIVPSPASNTYETIFYDVAAVNADDVWAVGSERNTYNVRRTLIEHWDGTSWTMMPSADNGTLDNVLTGVAVVASNDVWAVGSYTTLTLTEHWNGSTWAVVASPNVGSSGNYLDRVAVVGSNDVWAVGYYYNGSTFITLTMHWNGASWVYVTSPNVGSGTNQLYGVAAAGSTDVWATGEYYNGNTMQTLVEHWDGAGWSVLSSPNVGSGDNGLGLVLNLGMGYVWAVGTYNNGPTRRTLIEHYSLVCFTPSPTPTATPAAPSATPTPACTTSFSDVHQSDYFYAPVLYLACHGVISGYGDGTFRPYANTTRAQMVKIVVLGFSKAITTPPGGAYTFGDVPPSHPFFAVVETAAAGSIVGGYACGGPGEPCDGQQRPYFQPNANVTRGQLSKIVVSAAGWLLLDPPSPTFTDVPPGSAFYRFVGTAVCHSVISGYGDGTFRPGANATRGQIAKIVYLSLTAAGSCP